MKKSMVRPAVLLVAFGFAMFSAYAFTPAQLDQPQAVYQGHIQVTPGNCENKLIDCQDVNNGKPCKFGTVQLRKMNASGTSCPSLLWQIEP